MVHALVQFHVDEFEQFWRQFQARDFHLRQAHGSLGAQVFHANDDPTWVIILFQWESRRQMERFFPQLQSILPGNGVLEQRRVDLADTRNRDRQAITFLQKAGELDA